jgi:hypothetical protein
MEELSKLIDIIENKGKFVETSILDYSDNSNLETRLYNLVKSSKIKNEVVLANELYGSENKSSAYKMLKSRVKRKLYNQLFFLDIDANKFVNKRAGIELRCKKLLYFALILKQLEETALAEKTLNKVIATAQEANLVDYEIEGLEQLRVLIAEGKFNRKNLDECAERLERLYTIKDFINKANAMYFDVRFDIKLGVDTSHKFKLKLSNYIKDLESYWLASQASSVFYRYHQLKLMYYELEGDTERYIHYLKDTLELYHAGKLHHSFFSVNHNMFLLVYNYLKGKHYTEGLVMADPLKQQLQAGTNNWFAHLENYFLLGVHSENYLKAQQILEEALANKYLASLNPFAQERWLLYYKFFNYITGFKLPIYTNKKLKHVTHDKKGFNVWSQILDFIYVIEKDQPELVEREIDRLRKFIAKYLTSEGDARTKLFLKLLQVIGREYQNTKVCKRKGNYILNKLKLAPVAGYAYAEIEIVPYEQLWQIILLKLENKE